MVDQFRAAGWDVKLLHGEEGGREIGKRPVFADEGIDLMKPCLMEVDFSLLSRKRK